MSLIVITGKEPSEEQCNALEANLNSQLASNVRFLLMTPEEKQLIYESTIITSSFAALYHVEGTKHSDPLLKTYAQELARPIVKQWLGQ